MQYAIAAILLLPSLSFAQSPASRAAAALALAGVQDVAKPTYEDLACLAVKTNVPLVVWIGYVCPPCEADLVGCLHYHTGNFFGDTNPGIIVAMPRAGKLWHLGTMPTNSTTTQMRETMRETWRRAAPVDRWQEYYDETKRQGMIPFAQSAPMRGGC